MKSKCEVLNLEWATKSRDVNIVEPVLIFLEKKHSIKVIRESIWFAPLKIIYFNPKMLLISNSNGAVVNYNAIKFADKLGIKTAVLISEGDINEDPSRCMEMFWGWNKGHEVHEDLTMYWSERSKSIVERYIDESKLFNIKVSGATGFDRYKWLHRTTRDQLLAKYGKSNYLKVIGIAGWGFDLLSMDSFKANFSEQELDLLNKSRDKLQGIYKKIIESNTNVLFILKFHPGTIKEEITEFASLKELSNILCIKSEEEIDEVISICDLWFAFESTTCLEAWLLDKKTLLINPAGEEFRRSMISYGSPIYKTAEEINLIIDNWYSEQKFDDFEKKESERNNIIKGLMEYDDGKNHIRAGEYIVEELEKPHKKKCIDGFVVKQTLKELVRYIFIKTPLKYLKYKNSVIIEQNIQGYNYEERINTKAKYEKALENFYNKEGLEID